jgi:formylglycine-generating enzyme required for sulfatase activity
VDCKDFAIMAQYWLASEPNTPDITWVYIDDDGSGMKDYNGNPIDEGGFAGYMSKYETTNAQFAQYLNDALATGDLVVDSYPYYVDGNYVKGADGSNIGEDFIGQDYCRLDGSGYTGDGATNGGASRIIYSGGSFTVEAGFENHPVTYVSWYGATAFASYYGWRLPTEWEWQAVADYDGSFTYGCGTTINDNIANYYGSYHPHGTTPVGHFGTYGYGKADMAGNVWEWTSSLYDPAYSYRVFRSGSWNLIGSYCEVSFSKRTHFY